MMGAARVVGRQTRNAILMQRGKNASSKRYAVYKQEASLNDVEEDKFCVRGPVREGDAMESADEPDEFDLA